MRTKADRTIIGYCDRTFTIGPVTITPILPSHPNQGIGYELVEDGGPQCLCGCPAAGHGGRCRDPRTVYHNQDRADEGVDAILEDCRPLLAKANSGMQCIAVAEGMEIVLS